MQNLLLEEGSIVAIRSATLPKGTFVKLQPHTKDFLDITNPRAVLERTLRGYACLTKGDTICLPYNNKKYFIDVIEAKPQVLLPVASPAGGLLSCSDTSLLRAFLQSKEKVVWAKAIGKLPLQVA